MDFVYSQGSPWGNWGISDRVIWPVFWHTFRNLQKLTEFPLIFFSRANTFAQGLRMEKQFEMCKFWAYFIWAMYACTYVGSKLSFLSSEVFSTGEYEWLWLNAVWRLCYPAASRQLASLGNWYGDHSGSCQRSDCLNYLKTPACLFRERKTTHNH